jgi:hypothetical protein
LASIMQGRPGRQKNIGLRSSRTCADADSFARDLALH